MIVRMAGQFQAGAARGGGRDKIEW